MGRFLHAEQRFELFAPLPPKGSGFVRNRVDSVEDKGPGKGAIYRNVATLYADADCETALAQSGAAIYVMGGGGFGGPRPIAAPYALPDRAPDFTIVHETRSEQALLYRLSGDRHRLHSDPAFARERNFPKPILHGLCTYGFACRALVTAAAGDNPERLASMTARFVKPVYPGDILHTQIWLSDTGEALFRMLNAAGESVLESGIAQFRAL
jgi:acyl dehydratase